MTDEQITKAAREICAAQAEKSDTPEMSLYMSGAWDHTVVMRLVEQGIRRGLEGQAMVKTQHCPNCEATEQKLHDFRQEVSDAVEGYLDACRKLRHSVYGPLESFVISAPKPDPLVEVLNEAAAKSSLDDDDFAAQFRAALEARGLEIREKGK